MSTSANPSSERIRVLLADDHAMVRAGLRALLVSLAGVEVVAEAANGRDAARLAREHRPDIAMIDITMPELNGIDCARRIVQDCPATRVLMLSVHADETYLRESMQAGATGYLLKDSAPSELELALHALMRGEHYICPGVARHLVSDFVQGAAADAPAGPELTPRQREVLQLVAEGHGTRDIAARLNLSVKTIETHRAQLMERLDIHDVAGLTRYALRIGLVRDRG
jgi:DNA-binding NarL/FixJ family response regulator